jgi:hypothetical protein
MELSLRPTFMLDVPEPCARVTERLRTGLDAQPVWVKWSRVPGARQEESCDGVFAWIAMPESDQKFFSPWLQLSVMPQQDGSTQLFGRFSPKPAVWTGFALAYLFFGCVTFFSVMVGLSQLMVKLSPWAFYVTGATALVIVALYAISHTGKALADRQMLTLRAAVDAALAR